MNISYKPTIVNTSQYFYILPDTAYVRRSKKGKTKESAKNGAFFIKTTNFLFLLP